MKKTIGIIGHVDHGKTTLTAVIDTALKQQKEIKSIHEIIEEENTFKITAPKLKVTEWKVTESRRERRARERKNKKHNN